MPVRSRRHKDVMFLSLGFSRFFICTNQPFCLILGRNEVFNVNIFMLNDITEAQGGKMNREEWLYYMLGYMVSKGWRIPKDDVES